jgi:hypothetical protein
MLLSIMAAQRRSVQRRSVQRRSVQRRSVQRRSGQRAQPRVDGRSQRVNCSCTRIPAFS